MKSEALKELLAVGQSQKMDYPMEMYIFTVQSMWRMMKTSQMGHQKQLYIWMASKQEPFKLQKFMHISMTFGRTQAIFQSLQKSKKQQTEVYSGLAQP